MLQSLFLRDFLVVQEAEIEFARGFCVLTGETGAGKSILLDALGLALGARGDPAVISPRAARADIAARFSVNDALLAWLTEHDLAVEEDELLLRRVIDRDGRSKAYVNGAPVTVAQLRSLGEQLLEIHGQHASQSLLRADGQRALLDAFAGLTTTAAALAPHWRAWREAEQRLERARSDDRAVALEREQLSWQLEELEALALADDEWESLSAEQIRLANASGLIETTQAAHCALAEDDDSVRDRIDHLLVRLRQTARLDPALNNVAELLESARIQVDEAASELAGYTDRMDLDPARLAAVEARVGAVFQLGRKLRVEPGELAAHGRELAARLARMDQDRDLAALERARAERADAWRKAAANLSSARRKAARHLTDEASALLPQLGMKQARFEVHVNDAEPGPTGLDKVDFLFAGNQGFEMRALSRVASGGELSRVSLAIAVAAAAANPVPTLIFDEADAGVGGSVADAIGLLMRRLGEARQILAVTHLPQVAARAHGHYRVSRADAKADVGTQVSRLDDEQRVAEVARMLGGARVSATTREHAREMIVDAASAAAPAKPKPRKKARSTATRGSG